MSVSERLDAIEARKNVALCLTRFPSSPEAATAARNELVGVDVAYLLDLARKQQAALALTSTAAPVASCPTRLMDGRNEIRCWLPAGHEGDCK